jgi:hypothetical protein
LEAALFVDRHWADNLDTRISIAEFTIFKADNIGAKFMFENASIGFRTQQVNTHCHFTHGFIEDGFLKIEFVLLLKDELDFIIKTLMGSFIGEVSQEYFGN